MSAHLDLSGVRFGLLVAVERVGTRNRGAVWRCRCDCGNSKDVQIGGLRSGKHKSCGCRQYAKRSTEPKVCIGCGAVMRQAPHESPSLFERKRYCSRECWNSQKRPDAAPSTTRFRPGVVPWNRGLAGIHCSPDTEFKPGHCRDDVSPVGTERIRNDHGGPRAWVKISEPGVWKLRAIVAWETVNGPVPEGCIIHHVDRDPLHDAIENLQCLTRAQHLAEHRKDHRRRDRMREHAEIAARLLADTRAQLSLEEPEQPTAEQQALFG